MTLCKQAWCIATVVDGCIDTCKLHRDWPELRPEELDDADRHRLATLEPGEVQCDKCAGTGECDDCGGEGRIEVECERIGCYDVHRHDCDECDGDGSCESCRGTGIVTDASLALDEDAWAWHAPYRERVAYERRTRLTREALAWLRADSQRKGNAP